MSPPLSQTLRVLDAIPETVAPLGVPDGQWVDRLDQLLKDEGRDVPRSVIMAAAKGVLAPVSILPELAPAPPMGWWQRLLVWWRARRSEKATLVPRQSKPLTWKEWQQAREDQAIQSTRAPSATAVAYWKVRRARMYSYEEKSVIRWIWDNLTKPDEQTLPVKPRHRDRLLAAMATDATPSPLDTWAPCHYYDEPYRAFSHAPLLAECIKDGLTWRQPNADDRVLFEELLALGAQPDALFRGMPLPDSWSTPLVMSVREACFMTFQVELLPLLPARPERALVSRYDSLLWWVLGVHAEEDNVHLWARLRDEGSRLLPRILATVTWVLDHEPASALHEAILSQAMKANATWRVPLAIHLDRVRSSSHH